MKISLIGYGKTGKRVAALAKARGDEIINIFDQEHPIEAELLKGTVSIDFSTPTAFKEHYATLFNFSAAVVIGTTGWGEILKQVEAVSKRFKCSGVYASNFSLGMNVFMKILAETSRYLSLYQYQAYLLEKHHQTKKDRPSGTALSLQKILTDNHFNVDLQAIRCGEIKGEHEVGFESREDQLLLKHTCYSRDSFAAGALWAAEQISQVTDKKLYPFSELIKL